ncbi:MAG: hypothetical protein LBF97_06045 [Elusimicrobiota bacterium]|jgi:hypothetical protein|nr:hypothetical protein [Elusimicrobiota bacterium]
MKDILIEKNIKFVLENINRNIVFDRKNKKYFECAVYLVKSGILNYKKLTAENYNYWWYEVDITKTRINKKDWTFNFIDLEITNKGKKYLEIIKQKFISINNFLEYISILEDGSNRKEAQEYLNNLLYSIKKQVNLQLDLNF